MTLVINIEHYIMDTLARLSGLGYMENDCSTDKQEEEIVLHILGKCQTLCQKEKAFWFLCYANEF